MKKSELCRAAERGLFCERIAQFFADLKLNHLCRKNRQTAHKLEQRGML